MAYDLELAQRIETMGTFFSEAFTQKKMFGGMAFLYKGKMTVGVVKDRLMVRVIAEKMDDVLKMQAVEPMDFTGKPLKEFVFVSGEGFGTEEQLLSWMNLGLEHAKNKLGI